MEEQEPSPPAITTRPAKMRATIHITRKATGKTETYEIISVPDSESEQQAIKQEIPKE